MEKMNLDVNDAPTSHNPRRSAARRRLTIGVSAVLALALALGSALQAPSAALAAQASAETLDKLSAAEDQLTKVQDELNRIADEYTKLAEEQASTVEKIDAVRADIKEVEGQIEREAAKLAAKQDVLAERIAANYKSGGHDLLGLVLASSSFAELTSNIYYANKVCASDIELIGEVRAIKDELESSRMELKERESDLQTLLDEQTARMKEMQDKQVQTEKLVTSLSQEVKDLMDKRDAELAAAIEAEAEQRRRQALAAAAHPAPSIDYGSGERMEASGNGAAIVNACYGVGSPGEGLCAMWVSMVYQRGLGYYPGGNANDMYYRLSSSNRADLEPGMAIAVSTHPYTIAGRIYGHVGIYIGNGMVMDNIGYIRTISLDEWINFYGVTVPVRWGWL